MKKQKETMIMSCATPLLLTLLFGVILPWTIMIMMACSNNNNNITTVSPVHSSSMQQHDQPHQYVTSAALDESTSTPVIGILAQPCPNNQDCDYIASSYVKWLEVGGARSIAIPFDAYMDDKLNLDELFLQIHGILLPGGGSMITGPPPPTVQYLLNKVIALNNAGHYFPVWGTCLGFEYMIRHVANCTTSTSTFSSTSTATTTNKCPIQSGFDAENISLPLQQVVSWHLYQDSMIQHIVTTQNVTMNNHQLGISVDDFYNNDSLLSKVWKVTSINQDRNGRIFVSTIEPIDRDHFPLYGIQYHAEKNAFEYATYPNTNIPYEDINHSPDAIHLSIYTSTFFIQNLVQRSVIANPNHVYNLTDLYPPVYTYPIRSGESFEEVHIIPKKKMNNA